MVAVATGIKGFPTRGFPFRLDLASLVGPLFFMWVMQLLLPVSTALVVCGCCRASVGSGLVQHGCYPRAMYDASAAKSPPGVPWSNTGVDRHAGTQGGAKQAIRKSRALQNNQYSSQLHYVFLGCITSAVLPQTYVYQLVSERSGGTQLLMRQQGLRPAPAAVASYIWFAVLYGTSIAVFALFGAAIGLNVFTKTAPGVQVMGPDRTDQIA